MVSKPQDRVTEMLGLIAQFPNASATHIDYAEYVHALEHLFEQCQAELNTALVVQLRLLIFDMEVINGLALCDWEHDKCPSAWALWSLEYQQDADHLNAQLKSLLLGKQQFYQRDL